MFIVPGDWLQIGRLRNFKRLPMLPGVLSRGQGPIVPLTIKDDPLPLRPIDEDYGRHSLGILQHSSLHRDRERAFALRHGYQLVGRDERCAPKRDDPFSRSHIHRRDECRSIRKSSAAVRDSQILRRLSVAEKPENPVIAVKPFETDAQIAVESSGSVRSISPLDEVRHGLDFVVGGSLTSSVRAITHIYGRACTARTRIHAMGNSKSTWSEIFTGDEASRSTVSPEKGQGAASSSQRHGKCDEKAS